MVLPPKSGPPDCMENLSIILPPNQAPVPSAHKNLGRGLRGTPDPDAGTGGSIGLGPRGAPWPHPSIHKVVSRKDVRSYDFQ